MKHRCRISLYSLLFTLSVAGSVGAQDDAIAGLKAFDGQQRAAVETLNTRLRQSLPEASKVAALETELISVLDDPKATFYGKQEAARLLSVIGSAKSVPTLARMLTDEKLSNVARYALERNPDASAGQALRENLKTAKGSSVVVGIINSLGERKEAASVAVLLPFVSNPDTSVREGAVVALGKIGTGDALKGLQNIKTKDLTVYQAMQAGAERLVETGNRGQAEPVLLELAKSDKPPSVQVAALRSLNVLNPAKIKPLLLAGLRASDERVQVTSAKLYALSNEATGVSGQWAMLSPAVQTVLLATWAERGTPSAASLAVQSLDAENAMLRQTAIFAVARLEGAKVVPRLTKILTQANNEDKQIAYQRLVQMPGAEAETAILTAARSGELSGRVALVSVLAERGTRAGQILLWEMANGRDERIAIASLKVLGQIATSGEQPQLVKRLTTTQSEAVRDAAQRALVASAQNRNNREEVAETVLASLPGASGDVRIALISVLAELGSDKGLTAITQATTDSDDAVKKTAVAALADTWPDSRALPALLTVAKADSNKVYRVQSLRGALRLLGQDEGMNPEEKVGKVRDAMTLAERPEEKKQALSVLRDCRIPAAVELAVSALDDAALFEDAADTILYLAAPQKEGRREKPAVKNAVVTAALNKIIQQTKDETQREQARKLL